MIQSSIAQGGIFAIFVIGIVATMIGDVWHRLLILLRIMPGVGWHYVGRWVLGFRQGRFYAPDIGSQLPRAGEATVGWVFHYVIGIAYAAAYIVALGLLDEKVSLWTGLVFGAATLFAPLLVMQPAMGGGLFGINSPEWKKNLMLSASTHLVFGAGLFLGALAYGGLID